MGRLVPLDLPPWALPLIVLGLVVPAVAAFALAGPVLGLAVGALTAAVVVIVAARASYDEPIEVAPSGDRRYRLLVLASEPIEAPATVEALAGVVAEGERALDGERDSEPQVLVVAPALGPRLARWLSDVGGSRQRARRVIAISMGALTAAGIDAVGRVGADDAVQAVEDELRSYPADEVAVIAGPGLGAGELDQIRRRLDRPVRRL